MRVGRVIYLAVAFTVAGALLALFVGGLTLAAGAVLGYIVRRAF